MTLALTGTSSKYPAAPKKNSTGKSITGIELPLPGPDFHSQGHRLRQMLSRGKNMRLPWDRELGGRQLPVGDAGFLLQLPRTSNRPAGALPGRPKTTGEIREFSPYGFDWLADSPNNTMRFASRRKGKYGVFRSAPRTEAELVSSLFADRGLAATR
jgi:hypothetical protein